MQPAPAISDKVGQRGPSRRRRCLGSKGNETKCKSPSHAEASCGTGTSTSTGGGARGAKDRGCGPRGHGGRWRHSGQACGHRMGVRGRQAEAQSSMVKSTQGVLRKPHLQGGRTWLAEACAEQGRSQLAVSLLVSMRA
ncbi:hypothetical protein AK812_SmicGene3518 [Symbiodinium microadriaticum]|uniref:Uncharacterized protein n=1 Tax=Symbiodinium microadriaticum TaxID=2951 RepID=A0A1Q9EYS9_SYMMI|nr:hypothetical protein AK812_SmicGene3518 [Symbiodinium microadriaticum]